MMVKVNQITVAPVTDDSLRVSQEAAKKLEILSSGDLQLTAQELGFEKAKFVIAEMLHGLISEEAVVVAMDSVQAEWERLRTAEAESQT